MSEIRVPNCAMYALAVQRDGSAKKLKTGDPITPTASVAYHWVHIDLDLEGARDWIVKSIDNVVAEALTPEDTRPRYSQHGDGVLLSFRGVNLNAGSDPEDMISIRLWVTKELIVTVRYRRLAAVVAIREALERGAGPSTVGRFLSRLADGMTDRMAPIVDGISEEVDDLEERSLESASGLRDRLTELRRKTIVLRRYIGPQRDALARLGSDETGIMEARDKANLREVIDQVTRLVEEMDAVRERCGVLSDQIADQRAEEMNRNMMVLSVVAAIFLPLGFITGLLGINVGGIPGTESPYAFFIVCLIMSMIGGGITLLFRRLKWL